MEKEHPWAQDMLPEGKHQGQSEKHSNSAPATQTTVETWNETLTTTTAHSTHRSTPTGPKPLPTSRQPQHASQEPTSHGKNEQLVDSQIHMPVLPTHRQHGRPMAMPQGQS